MHRRSILAAVALHAVSCGSETKHARPTSAVRGEPSTVGSASTVTQSAAGSSATASAAPPPSESGEISDRQKECEAKLAALGLEHGKDSCKPKAPAAPLADEVQELPKKCAADSPRDKPCSSYGGTYKIRLAPDPAHPASCFENVVETTVRLRAETKYGDRRDLTWELGRLLQALRVRDTAPTLGSAVRDGVCCVDIDVSATANGKYKRVVIKLASGATEVNAKASVGCDTSGDRAPLEVKVTRTQL